MTKRICFIFVVISIFFLITGCSVPGSTGNEPAKKNNPTNTINKGVVPSWEIPSVSNINVSGIFGGYPIVTWDEVGSVNGYPIAGYKVYRLDSGMVYLGFVPAGSHTFTDLQIWLDNRPQSDLFALVFEYTVTIVVDGEEGLWGNTAFCTGQYRY